MSLRFSQSFVAKARPGIVGVRSKNKYIRIAARSWIFMALAYFLVAPTIAAQSDAVQVNAATVGHLYAYTIATTRPARFEKSGGNAGWLSITPEGMLTGTPDRAAPAKSEIQVKATSAEGAMISRIFIIPVYQPCGEGGGEVLAWCDGEMQDEHSVRSKHGEDIGFRLTETQNDKRGDMDCPQDSAGCIVQFSRVRGFRGDFGHFKGDRVAWHLNDYGGDGPIIDAINGSRAFLSGSVLIHKAVDDCKFLSWMVLTQSVDSSNIVFYGPSEVSAFCTESNEVLIVLPVHAIWADVYGTAANVNDPGWKPTPEPKGYECYTGANPQGSYPTQGIRPCDKAFPKKEDIAQTIPCPITVTPCNSSVLIPAGYEDQKPRLPTSIFYRKWIAWNYNRLTQPGVSQGSISIAPIALGLKNAWDVQTYESARLGPGWLGIPVMYEYDHTQKDDLNSLTAAVIYDFRFDDTHPYLHAWSTADCNGLAPTGNRDCEGITPMVGIRRPEFSVRFGPEWAPSHIKPPKGETQVPLRDLNTVMGATLRLPITFNPFTVRHVRQPAQITLAPMTGVEFGTRVDSHTIANAPQPNSILRWVAGADASVRWPYNLTHNFLGDKPLTVDFSYRVRRLYYEEPFTDLSTTSPEMQSLGQRSYTRVTFIAPFSAYLQFRASWQHGALPPAFQYVGNLVTVGLTFSNPGYSEH